MFNKYPYTDFHELNLDWVLNEISTLETDYKDFRDDVTEQMTAFNLRLDGLVEEIDAQLDEALREMNDAIDAFTQEISQDIDNFTNEMNSMMREMRREFQELKIWVTAEIESQIFESQIPIKADIANLDARVSDIETQGYPEFYNPFTGNVENLAPIIFSIYYATKKNPLTAQEYADLGLTASQYASYGLTARQYDFEGKTLLV